MRTASLAILLAGYAAAQNAPLENNRYQGSVAAGQATGETLHLSLAGAIARGMRANLGNLLADQQIRYAEGARGAARSELMPKLTAGVSELSEQINLAAFGFSGFAGVAQIVGPFQIFDTRAYLSQPLLNRKSLYNTRVATAEQKAAALTSQDGRDIVALVVTGLYLQTGATLSRIETGRAQVEAAQAVYNQAVDFQKSGVVPAIDALRAEVELQTQQQRLIAYRGDVEKVKLRLARTIGLADGQPFDLSDQIPYTPPPAFKVEEAIERAYASRRDYQSAAARVQAAQLARKAAEAERLPTASLTANYGVIGSTPDRSHGTYAAGVNLEIPIFQGGKVQSKVLEADAELERRRAEMGDIRGRIAFEVRTAYIDLGSAEEQVRATRRTIDLAERQLTQARDRFAAGVTGNLEVVQAQEALAGANENYIASLFAYNAAKATLARSLGNAEKTIPLMLQGGGQ